MGPRVPRGEQRRVGRVEVRASLYRAGEQGRVGCPEVRILLLASRAPPPRRRRARAHARRRGAARTDGEARWMGISLLLPPTRRARVPANHARLPYYRTACHTH